MKIFFLLSAVCMIFVSLRNLTWNGLDEKSRADRMLRYGIFESMFGSSCLIMVLGGLVVFLHSDLRFTALWLLLGTVLLFMSSLSMLVSIFGDLHDQPLKNTLSPETLDKRRKQRWIVGLGVMIAALTWVYSGVGHVI